MKSPSAEQMSVENGSAEAINLYSDSGGPRVPEAFTAQLKSFLPQISQLIVVSVNTIHKPLILCNLSFGRINNRANTALKNVKKKINGTKVEICCIDYL